MLGTAEFNEIKQTNVSKDGEKTKQRVKDLWKETQKAQREEILNLSGLKKFTVERTYKNGNISVKLAAAFAQVLSINPYYFTGDSDDRNEYSDELLRKFLVDNGYGKLFEADSTKKKNTRKKTSDNNENNEDTQPEGAQDASSNTEEVKDNTLQQEIENGDEQPEITTEAELAVVVPPGPIDVLLTSRIKEKIKTTTHEELEKLELMPEERAAEFLKGLYLRSEYSEEAKNLSVLVKLLMTL